jgi:hypothetical protein
VAGFVTTKRFVEVLSNYERIASTSGVIMILTSRTVPRTTSVSTISKNPAFVAVLPLVLAKIANPSVS